MAGINPPTLSPEETMAAIVERMNVLKASERPPLFDLNVSRRNAAGIPQQLASFSNATFDHITNPLRWLPQLLGGGEYTINVRHPDVPDRIGGPIPVNIDKTLPGMEPKAIDPRIARAPSWPGPTLVGGAYQEPAPTVAAGATALPWGNPFGSQVTTGYGMPTLMPAPQSDREREQAAQLAELRAQLARTEAEAKARAELESERRASAERLREAERKTEEAVRAAEARTAAQLAEMRATLATATTPKVDNGWKDLIALAMPLVQSMLNAQQEMRVLMLKTSEEQNRRQIEASEKQHAAQMAMIQAITAQKPGMSEEMKMLIESLKSNGNSGEAMASFMTKQLEAMGIMSRMATDLVTTAAELQLGDSEHPVTGMIRAAVDAMKSMSAGSREASQRIIPKKPQQPLPPGMTPQQYAQWQLQQQQARAQRAAAAAGRQPPPKAPPQPPAQQPPPQAQPQPQQAPVPVVTFTEPAAAPQPAGPVLMTTPDGRQVTHFDILKAGIEALRPPEEVVDYLVQLKNNDELSLKQKLDAVGGSPWQLIQQEFATGFLLKNKGYLKQLGEIIDARGVQEGWWEEEPDDDGEEEESEQEAGPTLVAVELGEATIPLEAAPAAPVPEAAAVVVAEPQPAVQAPFVAPAPPAPPKVS